jgi:hypothetical protein
MEADMTERIPARLARLMAVGLVAIGALAMTAGSASAAETVYTNFNTVPGLVNGFPNQDTYSLDSEYFPVGGMVEFPRTRATRIKALSAQVDSFTCEHGVYSLENCFTLRVKPVFKYQMTAKIFAAGPNNEPIGAPVATSTQTMKIPFRPTTNVSCPNTSEGKGFGPNCDVGGLLATVTFKRFTPLAVLPVKAIIEVEGTNANPPGDIVNIGLQASYKEYVGGEFKEEPAQNKGIPAIGSNPLPNAVYLKGVLNEENWLGFQPVFEVTAIP